MAGTRTVVAPYSHFHRMAGGFALRLRLQIASRQGPDTSARVALYITCRLGRPGRLDRPSIANGCAPCTSARAALDTTRRLAHPSIANHEIPGAIARVAPDTTRCRGLFDPVRGRLGQAGRFRKLVRFGQLVGQEERGALAHWRRPAQTSQSGRE
jgi:hypothetical protein